MECLQIVALSSFLRKRSGDLLERVAREAAAGEPPQQCRGDGLTLEEPPSAGELGLEGGDGAGGFLGRDQSPAQVGTNRRIAVTAAREQLGTALGEARVVEHAGTLESFDRLLPCKVGVPSP